MALAAACEDAAAGDSSSDDFDSLAEKQRLKAALHYSAGKVCTEVEGVEFSREVVAAVTEAAFNQSQLLAWDIEAFAKHAKRTVIAPEDVRLCCRRNDDLLTHMTELLDKLKSDREARKTSASHGGGGGRGGGGGERGGGGGEDDIVSKAKKTLKRRKLSDIDD